jgi:RNA polymerase sigma-70 factor (ECF subfamily)
VDDFRKAIVTLLPRLRRIAWVLSHDAVASEDLVQATIEKCLAKQDHWQAGTRLDSSMYRIMRNLGIDETRLRARRRETTGPQAEAAAVADPLVVEPETRLQALSVESAVAELPAEQREAVALVLIDGMTYRDACAVLGIPIGTLTSRLSRARAALAAKLEPELCDEA